MTLLSFLRTHNPLPTNGILGRPTYIRVETLKTRPCYSFIAKRLRTTTDLLPTSPSVHETHLTGIPSSRSARDALLSGTDPMGMRPLRSPPSRLLTSPHQGIRDIGVCHSTACRFHTGLVCRHTGETSLTWVSRLLYENHSCTICSVRLLLSVGWLTAPQQI